MKEEEKLLKLDLKKEQQKQSLTQTEGLELYFFRALYSIYNNSGLNHFCDILFTIIQFIQLMAFPMDTVFSSGWKTYWYGTIGNFFRYFQLIYLWGGNTQFFLITYLITCLYMLLLSLSFINILFKSKSLSYNSKIFPKIISVLLEFEILLNIPFIRTLFSIFTCQNDNIKDAPDIKCLSNFHYCLIIISSVFIILFTFLIILFRSTIFEFGTNNDKLKASYSSSTEVLLIIVKILLSLLYQFVRGEIALSIITFLLSIILLFDFNSKQPFSNGSTMKLYSTLYLLFFWSCTICIVGILLKNSNFEGGILLLIIGYPFIIFSKSFIEWDYSFDKIFEYSSSKHNNGYKALLDIEFFLKMEETLEDKIRTKPQKVLYSYISNYERNCSTSDCPLKQFLKIPLKVENFVEMRICLLQHAEMLYKNAITRFPFYAKLRLSYGLFLYNKLNKKLKGTNEITLLNKYNTNLEDSFLIYKAQRFIQDDNDELSHSSVNNNRNQDINSNNTNAVIFKTVSNNIKSLINKITMNYIDFWTILATTNDNKSENFHKLSKIGSKISTYNEELTKNIEKLENINLYEQDIFKLYIQYLTEILNNNAQANIYNSKLDDNDSKKHLYNEDNLFDLNYKAMSKSEDYKYVILNCSHANFNCIANMSLSVCTIFGYSREELIGHSFDYILPEIFCTYHRKILEDKIDNFKKKLLIKDSKIRSDSWIFDLFVKNKMKYLVPFKVRWTLISSQEEIIYGIGKVLSDSKISMVLEQDIVYILTDKDLIIQTFTSNAPKYLCLHSSAINNNLDITDYIKEFSEDSIIDNLIDIKESSISSSISVNTHSKKRIKYAKLELLKKMFLNEKDIKKVIHWKFVDVLISENNKMSKKPVLNKRSSFARVSLNEPKFQSAFIDNKSKSKIKVTPKRKKSVGVEQNNEPCIYNKKYSLSTTDDRPPNFDSEKVTDLKDTIISDLNEDFIINDKKEKIYLNNSQHYKFNLSVKEVKFNEIKIGYIFKFEPYSSKNAEEKSIIANNKNNPVASKHDISTTNKQVDNNEIEKSEISVVSFSANKQPMDQRNSFMHQNSEINPFCINAENNDAFLLKLNKDKENQFTLDLNSKKMSYKQLGLKDNSGKNGLFEQLRTEAVEKIAKAAKQVKNDELSEEEEESSSGSYYTSANDSSNENSSERKNDEQSSQHSTKDVISQDKYIQKSENNSPLPHKKPSVKDSTSNTPLVPVSHSSKGTNLNINLNQLNVLNTNTSHTKHKEDDYYHVDVSNITYYLYNYTSGFVEVVKDQKYKISQVVKQTNAEKEKLSKMNAKYIANPKLAKEKKRGNANKKIADGDDELNAYSEKMIKLKEIQKALTSKEKQRSTINLCIFSFVIFILVVGTGIMSIMINFYLKNEIFMYYELIKGSILFYKNLLIEINFIRELIIMNSSYYGNFYDSDKEHYFSNFTFLCYNYYLDSSNLVSNMNININKLNQRQKNIITQKKIDLYIIDPIKSNGTSYKPKRYDLLLFSAYRELNSAIYHISQLKMEEIYTYEDNVYYFIKNGMSKILIASSDLIDLLVDESYHVIKKGHLVIIICFVVLFVVYCACFFIFIIFYQRVEERKQSYLSVFYEIKGELIILSLAKCEKFAQKLQSQEDNTGGQGDKISLDSSTIDDSNLDNDIQAVSSIIKHNKDNKANTSKTEKNIKNNSLIGMKIIGFIIFFILLIYQYSYYIFYYIRLSYYQNGIKYEHYVTEYTANFIIPFICIREYIYEKNKWLFNIPVKEYINGSMHKLYVRLTELSNQKEKYEKFFPNEFNDYLNDLYNNEMCNFINIFINEYPDNGYTNCTDFLYGVSDYGFFAALTSYIEEIRTIKDLVDEYNIESKARNFIYNESFFNDPNGVYEELYKNSGNEVEYRQFNSANAINSTSHKNIFIAFRFIISKVVILTLNKLFSTFESIFDATTKISLIMNIAFILIVFIGFSLFWLPFVVEVNETIFKTKNMLSIIPNEILITLPHINIMLGIDGENN